MKGIPLYHEINQLHELTGASIRADNPLFHCFDMAHTNDLKTNKLSPHRANFYTLAISFGTQDLHYSLNETHFEKPENFILCVAPGQLATWEKKGDWFGFCTFFKSEFLQYIEQINFLQHFPFFRINETNLIPVSGQEFEELSSMFRQVLTEQNEKKQFYGEILRSQFLGILWLVRRIYEKSHPVSNSQKAAQLISARFQLLVNDHFLTKVAVEDYANLLNISTNHLSQMVKQATGKNAKRIINERRLDEAKYLLAYSHHSISEIAYHLLFAESTHFSRFFKRESSLSPQAFRNQHQSI